MVIPRPIVTAGLCLIAGCSAPAAPASITSSQAASASTTPSASAQEFTVAPTPTATAAKPVLAVGGFAEVVTTDLVLRSAPGVGPDSEIYGTIEHLPAYLIDGPVQADGYEWWLVAHERMNMLGGPPAGWVAARGKDGEVWLAPAQPECPEVPTGEWFEPSMWVSCYTGVELTLGGALAGCGESVWAAWEEVCYLYPCPVEQSLNDCLGATDIPSVSVHFGSVPERAYGLSRVSLSGHFDDAAAERCAVEGDPLSVFRCRSHFVVTAYRFTD